MDDKVMSSPMTTVRESDRLFQKLLSFSYDSPGVVWEDDWRGIVFSLLIGADGRYKVSSRLPFKAYDAECVYCVGNVNAERLSEVVGSIDGDGDDWGSWLLPLDVENKIRSILPSLKVPDIVDDRDTDDYNPIYLFTLFDGGLTRQYRFNRNNARGYEQLIEISNLMRCGRGGSIGQIYDFRGGAHDDGDALVEDALLAISGLVTRFQRGESTKDDVWDEYCFWLDEIEENVNGRYISDRKFQTFKDKVFDMTIVDDIFDLKSEQDGCT